MGSTEGPRGPQAPTAPAPAPTATQLRMQALVQRVVTRLEQTK